jgi:hypothetical protein
VKISAKTVIARFNELVGNTAEVPINPFRVFFRGVHSFFTKPLDALVLLPGNGVLGKRPVQCQFVVIEDVFLAGASCRVDFGTAERTKAKERVPDKDAAAEGS